VSKRSSIIDNDHYGHNDHYRPIINDHYRVQPNAPLAFSPGTTR